MSEKIYILNGPNLNLLGQREPEIYGHETLADIECVCTALAGELDLELRFEQSNHEGALIDWIHEARGDASGIIINAGAYTHSSIALYDALRMFDWPIIELHISNVHQREEFRQHSYISPAASAVMSGFGVQGYCLALRGIKQLIEQQEGL